MNNKEIKKRHDVITKNTIKCKCGRSCYLGCLDYIICNWCGNLVFKNKKVEFEYRLKSHLLKR